MFEVKIMANNKNKKKTANEVEIASKYAPKNPAKTPVGRIVIIVLCAAMVILPLVALIISLCLK